MSKTTPRLNITRLMPFLQDGNGRGGKSDTPGEFELSSLRHKPGTPSDVDPTYIYSWKAKWYAFLDDPDSSTRAKRFSELMMILILVSLASLVLEPDPAFRSVKKAFWVYLDMVIVLCFSVELGARLYCCPDRGNFLQVPMHWFDFLSILPFYIDLVINEGLSTCCDNPGDESNGGGGALMRALRTIRLFRILRILRVTKHNPEFATFAKTLAKSFGAVRILILLMILQILIFGVLVYDVEKGSNPKFTSVPKSMWWAVVTSCTVGYGDIYPITNLGKVFAAVTMVTGVVVMSLPLSIIGANCVREYMFMQEQKEMTQAREEQRREEELKTVKLERRMSQQLERATDTFNPWRAKIIRVCQTLYNSCKGEGEHGLKVLMVVTFCIVLSIVTMILKSMPEFDHVKDDVWDDMEAFCVSIFTIDILVQLLCCPDLKEHLTDKFTWLDILATVPFYFSKIGLEGADLLLVLRTLRVVRLMKLLKHDPGIQVLMQTLDKSFSALMMYLAVGFANMLFFSVSIFEFERGEWDKDCECYLMADGSKPQFTSVIDGFYWVLSTISTVGYGDIFPQTTMGQLIGSVCCVMGTLSIMLPLTIVGVNFCTAYDRYILLKQLSGDSEPISPSMYRLRDELENFKRELTEEFGDILCLDIVSRNVILQTFKAEQLNRLRDEAIARRKFAEHHNMSLKDVTQDMVRTSEKGIEGWAKKA